MAFFSLFMRKQIAKRAKKKLMKKNAEKNVKIKNKIRKLLHISEDSWIYKKFDLFMTQGTFENFLYTSFIGFLGGILLTYMFFFFFIFQLNFSFTSATILCSIFGCILTLGLAYSMRVRCIVFLLLPQFCSKKGRQALMAYAFILTLTGPAKNTLHNIGVLTESLACGQDQVKEAARTVMDIIKQPFYALKDSITKIIKTVKATVKKIKQFLMAIKKLVLSILRVIKAVFQWLAGIVNICNKTLGTPFDRCSRAFEGAVIDCKAKLGSVFGELCNIVFTIKTVCYILKPLDLICGLVSYVANAIIETVERQIRKFTTEMRAMFYVKVKFSHSFSFETNQSRTFEEVSSGIANEIRMKTEKFLSFFDWMSLFTTFFVFFMLLRVLHFRYKWLTSDRFDNWYITREVRQIDLIRGKQDKETILPLGFREKFKYTSLNSIRLVKSERKKLATSMVFLSLATFKFLFHIAADYSLYWMLDMIRYHGRIELKVQKPNSVGIYVSGTGFLAELYKSIIKAFNPIGEETTIDSIPCLPDPTPPDYDRYTNIILLVSFCWIMAFTEPYGLRLRHVVMNYYHPDRAKQRAVWLYNNIIRSRGSFLKFARRQLRRKFGISNGQAIEKVTFADRMYTLCPVLNLLFPREQKICLLCSTAEKTIPHIKCPNPNCVGLYCTECFSDLQKLCTICKSPIEYGDYSDLSEEKDSSEEDIYSEKLIKFQEQSDQTSNTDLTIIAKEKSDSETDSLSSYSYQYESSSRTSLLETNPLRDIEAQKLRDDVTTRIFEYSDLDSDSDSPSSSTIEKPKLETDLTTTSASSKDKLQLLAPFTSQVETPSNKKLDKDARIPLLLPKKDKTRLERFFRTFSEFFKSKKPLNIAKRNPLEELKEFLDKTRKECVQDEIENDSSDFYSDNSSSKETVLFLNVSEARMRMNYDDSDYLIVNDNFNSDSETEINNDI